MSDIQLIDKKNIDELDWSRIEDSEKLQLHVKNLIKSKSTDLIAGSDFEVSFLKISDKLIPLVFSGKYKRNRTYVSSLKIQYVDYPKEELRAKKSLKKSEKLLYLSSFPLLSAIFSLAKTEKSIFVNNWLFSTNLFPKLSPEEIQLTHTFLREKFPKHNLIFKSVFDKQNTVLAKELLDLNYHKLLSRQVYFFDPREKKKPKRPFVQDSKRWDKNEVLNYDFLPEPSDEQLEKVREYYKNLYIGKHSSFNPDYSISFLRSLYHSQVLRLMVIQENSEVLGFQGVSQEDETLTTPMIGYDLNLPKEKYVYRFLNLLLMKEAVDKEVVLNMSSGAGKFKKQRGGVSDFEYNYIFIPPSNSIGNFLMKKFVRFSEKTVKENMIKYEF